MLFINRLFNKRILFFLLPLIYILLLYVNCYISFLYSSKEFRKDSLKTLLIFYSIKQRIYRLFLLVIFPYFISTL